MPPRKGHFILHSNVLPAITAGAYELVSRQTGLPFDVAEERTHVTVSSPRYTMPVDQILSTFPPANAEGAFGDRLPQIVLKRRTLPWERNPAGQAAASPKPWLALVVVAEGEAQLSTPTPVADCVTSGVTLLDPADRDVDQGLYLAVTQTVLRKIFPTEEDLALLTHVREVDVTDTELAGGDDDGWLAVVLANRLPVAEPGTGKAVRYMACLVNVEGQLDRLPPPEPPDDHFTFELAQDWRMLAKVEPGQVVEADRWAMGAINGVATRVMSQGATPATPGDAAPMAPGARAAVAGAGYSQMHMRSSVTGQAMDGSSAIRESAVGRQWAGKTAKQNVTSGVDPDATRLVRDRMASGFRLPIEYYATEPVYRFPVLAHWSFTTSGDQTFETLMRDLDVGLVGTVERADAEGVASGSESAPQPAPAARPPAEVVETGHIGLDHRTRRGDATRAWYRGPLVPFPCARDSEPGGGTSPLAHDADQLRRVVPDGREDLSLAAAFEIGRLLALSQLSVVSALLRFRGEQFGVARALELMNAAGVKGLPNAGAQLVDLGRLVSTRLIGELAVKPERYVGPRRPVADPGRALKVKGALDEVVAEGLGLDLGRMKEMSAKLGVVHAIARGAVPLADPDGVHVLDKGDLSELRATLGGALAQVANVAAPPRQVVTGPRAAAPAAAARARASAPSAPPPPDPLDELIQRAAELNLGEEE